MTLRSFSTTDVAAVRHGLRRRVTCTNYDDLNRAALMFRSTGKWVWEATMTHDLVVTLRRIDGTRINSFDDNIVKDNDVFSCVARSSAGKDIAKAISYLLRTKRMEVEVA